MKPRKPSKATARRKSGGGMLVGIFLGLVLGVLCAAGVVWYIFKTPPPFSNKGQPSPSAAQQAGATVAPLALPGKPGDPVPQNGDKPRFDFYKILPGNAEAIPDPKPTEVVKDKGEKENMLKESVYLQTGSFQNVDDADNQKTKLALMGVEASVQQVMLQDRVWYRVRLGPFRKMDEVNNMRSDLAKQGIEASLVRKD
ncbi:MAG TPA: SPOR domain-containing protein [Candidatus Propionivibrio aalborgensis]|nr:SPOR domain-containing protein [Candidatus Propionivibrio aalborgensis]